MKDSHIEGVAIHDAPESCAGSRKAEREVLTGVHTGSVLSREIGLFGVPTLLSEAEGNMSGDVIASLRTTPRGRSPGTCVEPSCTRTGRSLQYLQWMVLQVA
jgi:hypothetical protein